MDTFKTALMKGSLGAAAAALLGACASAPGAGRTGSLRAAPEWSVPAGGHCESSALANALGALGWNASEADIAGGGGAPAFFYDARDFPFLGGRSLTMREDFFAGAGIPFRAVVPSPGEDAWAPVFALLAEGRPVPLRVDLRRLPYRYGGKMGPSYMAFGWHWVALFAVDFDAGLAYLSDTELPGLQAIRLKDLDDARTAKLKAWPPRSEYVVLEKAPAGSALDRDALAGTALRAALANYGAGGGKGTLAGEAGLDAFPEALRGFGASVKPYLAGPALGFLAGCIERNGTGGAAFRILFRTFIASAVGDLERSAPAKAAALRGMLPALDASIDAWRKLTAELDASAAAIGAGAKGPSRQARYDACAQKASALAAAERALRAAEEKALAAWR